jgi:hypothetical protein
MNTPTHRATGWINVTHYDLKPYDESGSATLSEVYVTEDFTGGLVGTGIARFLLVATAEGVTYFTGIERVVGNMAGRTGSFVLRNTGILKDGAVTSDWFVIPGTATGELTGLRGTGGAGPSGYFLDSWFE